MDINMAQIERSNPKTKAVRSIKSKGSIIRLLSLSADKIICRNGATNNNTNGIISTNKIPMILDVVY